MNIKTKKRLMKILSMAIVVIFTIICLQNVLYAAGGSPTIINEIDTATETEKSMDGIFSSVGGFVDGLVGVLTFVFRVPLILIGMALQGVFTMIAELGGSQIQGLLTPDDLFYNRVGLTNIDFFDFSSGGAITTIRTNVATWYYVLRIFAIIILLVVLIYIGIRMAVSTVASEQAQYKRMLMDWAVSFALVFFLGYIIMFTIEANKAFLEMLETTVNNRLGNGITMTLIETSIIGGATSTWSAVICYLMLVGITAAFLFSYIKRMLTIGFLIIISPLITITYSIDRVKDGKAQALNTWLKEFMFTVLIQPFHCIIYTVFVSASLDLIKTNHSIASLVLSIMCMAFIWQAEKIVKTIFGFDQAKTSLGDTVASALIVKEIGTAVTKGAQTAGKAITKSSFGRNINQRINNNPQIANIRNSINSSPRLKQIAQSAQKIERKAMATGMSASMGIGAAALEKGMNTNANAAQVGLQTYNSTKALFDGMATGAGSRQNIQQAENDIERYVELMAKNNASIQNFRTDNNQRDTLKNTCESLINTNMRQLDDNIQRALQNAMAANPTEYNLNTPQGINNLRRLQDAALDMNTDFTDPRTNPLYDPANPAAHPAWTTEEENVVRAIQTRNLASAVQNADANYKAAGYQDTAVKDFIDTL